MKTKKAPSSSYRTDHMANERTFLAWIRTSIGIMAFGFVVEKFALFIKKIGQFFGGGNLSGTIAISTTSQRYTSFFGILLVLLGAIIGISSYIRYKNISKQIEKNSYQYSQTLATGLTVLIVMIGIFLTVYLILT